MIFTGGNRGNFGGNEDRHQRSSDDRGPRGGGAGKNNEIKCLNKITFLILIIFRWWRWRRRRRRTISRR